MVEMHVKIFENGLNEYRMNHLTNELHWQQQSGRINSAEKDQSFLIILVLGTKRDLVRCL